MTVKFASMNGSYFCQSDQKPSCWTCIHGQFHAGSNGSRLDPPEPDHMECSIDWPKVDETTYLKLDDLGWKEDECPAICGKYEPQMIVGACPCGCGQEINAPAYSYPYALMASTFYGNPVPVVTPECRDRMMKRYSQEEIQYMESHLKQ